MSNKDYYKILGIQKDASDNEIKKAFHKLALVNHPDKGGDKETFQKINVAYETLSDPDKRREYDNPNPFANMNHMGHGHSGSFTPFFNPFDHIFTGGMHGNMHFSSQPPQPKKCNDSIFTINLELKDAHKELNKTYKISIKKTCLKCLNKCDVCNGSGQQTVHRQMGPMTQVTSSVCNSCGGKGELVKKRDDCECGGKELVENRKIEVKIPTCAPNGHSIIFEGLGEQPSNKIDKPGNLVFKVLIKDSDEHFIRRDNNLVYTTTIDLKSSLIGKIIEIPHYDNPITLNINTLGIINPKKEYILFNMGLGLKGNLILRFNIEYPEITLLSDQIQVLTDAFNNINLQQSN